MITLENKTNTVVFWSNPSQVYQAGSISKTTAKVLFYNDGQGVDIRDGDFRVTFTHEMLNQEFATTHNITNDTDLFNLLVTWQNS